MLTTRALFVEHGIRCTDQRLALFHALRKSKSHPTAEELYRIVKPTTSRLSLATVYNTLELLCSKHLCRRMPSVNGSCRFDADMSDHMHVRVRDTGEILDVPGDLGEQLHERIPQAVLSEIGRQLGVTVEGVNVQLVARLGRDDV